MKGRRGPRRLLVAAAVLLLIGAGCTDEDSPIVAVDTADEYVFVFNGASTNQYWRYSITTQVLDTFFLAVGPVNAMAVSPDNRLVYIPQSGITTVLACDSLTIVEELPFGSTYGVAVSPDGKLVALHDVDVTRLIRTTDWTVVRADFIVGAAGMFSRDNLFYFCTGSRSGESQAVHMIPADPFHSTDRKELSGLTPDLIRVSPTGERWYLYDGVASDHGIVAVYESATDSLVATFDLPTSNGVITLSPDGTRLYASAPGAYGVYPPVYPSQKIFEFDTQTPALLREIDLTNIPAGSGLGPTDLARLTVSDDGTRLIGSSGYVLSYLLDLDIATLTPTELYDFGNTGAPFYMSE